MISGIVLDFGQTLVDSSAGFRRAEKKAQREIWRDLAFTSYDDFLHMYREIRSKFHRARNFSRSSMWKEVYGLYGRDVAMDAIRKMELEYWETVKRWTKPFGEIESSVVGAHRSLQACSYFKYAGSVGSGRSQNCRNP